MERPLETDDLGLSRGLLGTRSLVLGVLSDKFECALVGFGSRVGEEDFGGGGSGGGGGRGETETAVGFSEGDEQVGARSGPDVVVDVGGVDEEGGLVEQELGDLREEEAGQTDKSVGSAEGVGTECVSSPPPPPASSSRSAPESVSWTYLGIGVPERVYCDTG